MSRYDPDERVHPAAPSFLVAPTERRREAPVAPDDCRTTTGTGVAVLARVNCRRRAVESALGADAGRILARRNDAVAPERISAASAGTAALNRHPARHTQRRIGATAGRNRRCTGATARHKRPQSRRHGLAQPAPSRARPGAAPALRTRRRPVRRCAAGRPNERPRRSTPGPRPRYRRLRLLRPRLPANPRLGADDPRQPNHGPRGPTHAARLGGPSMKLTNGLDDLQRLRAARWVRESTRGQYDTFGPEAQREQQDRAIERYGLVDTGLSWTVAHSGRTVGDTAQFHDMLSRAGTGYDVLVVGYVSRFARDLRHVGHRPAPTARCRRGHPVRRRAAAVVEATRTPGSSGRARPSRPRRTAAGSESASGRATPRSSAGWAIRAGNAPLGFRRDGPARTLAIDPATIEKGRDFSSVTQLEPCRSTTLLPKQDCTLTACARSSLTRRTTDG